MWEACDRPARIILASIIVFTLFCATAAPTVAQAPAVNLSPSSGPIGTKVTVSACGMVQGNAVLAGDITLNGEPWNTRTVWVDSSGCMCAMPLTVPPDAYGPIPVTVYDGNVTATGIFTLKQPNITVSPTSGYKGETVTVTGTGWVGQNPVTVTFQGTGMDSLFPDAAGSFVTQFEIPLTAAPTNVVSAFDNLGNVGPGLLFALRPPGIGLSPLSGPPGTSVQVHGYGFEPLSGVQNLRIASFPIGDPGMLTSSTGSFVTTFEAPNLPGGGYIVTATVADVSLDACFTIFAPEVFGPADEGLPTPIEQALATVSHNVVRVWGYADGEWRMYDPADPLGCNLSGLVRGRGYWVKVNGDCTLIFRELRTGWNNIGW